MNDIIIIDGVKYQRVVEEEPAEEPKENPFDINECERYYWINAFGEVNPDTKYKDSDPCIAVANACKDKELMEQRALHEILDRLLWRASIEAGELNNPWNRDSFHYYIYSDKDSYTLKIDSNYACQIQGICYFPSEESAQAAIDNVVKPFMAEHPDFAW